MGEYDADPELMARLEAECEAQGIPLRINDPATLRYIANIVTSSRRARREPDQSDSRRAG